MWAYAKMVREPGAGLMRGLERQAEAVAGSFNAQNVANTLWAYATMKWEPCKPWLTALTARLRGVKISNVRDGASLLSSVASFALMEKEATDKFDELVATIVNVIDDVSGIAIPTIHTAGLLEALVLLAPQRTDRTIFRDLASAIFDIDSTDDAGIMWRVILHAAIQGGFTSAVTHAVQHTRLPACRAVR